MEEHKKRQYSFTERILFPSTLINRRKLEKELYGKTIVITGASYGVGRQLAQSLSFTETLLILVGRTKSKLEEVKLDIESTGGKAEIYSCDLRNDIEIESFIRYLKQDNKTVDIFVNNAGKSIRRSVSDSLDRFHDFKRTMDINYFAPVKLTLALIPILEQKKGHIINISAINVLLLPAPKWSAYQSSKTAIDQWFRSNSPELQSKGIKTSTVYLPLVKTRMMAPTKAYEKLPAMKPEHVAKIIGKLLLNKRRKFKPWWLGPIEVVSIIFKKPITYFIHLNHRNK